MLAVIGGSALDGLPQFGQPRQQNISTAWAAEPVTVLLYDTPGGPLALLPRHGKHHAVPPHRINYRANIAALAESGVGEIIAINAVGGIHARAAPGSIILPTQLIDYTWGRAGTFFEEDLEQVVHADFTEPFSTGLRQRLLAAVYHCAERTADRRTVLQHGTYGCTQGPRLETAAEIRRLQQDGCDMVGMTAMPEAVLAREQAMDYAMLALTVNWAAGVVPQTITMEQIRAVVAEGAGFLRQVITRLVEQSAD